MSVALRCIGFDEGTARGRTGTARKNKNSEDTARRAAAGPLTHCKSGIIGLVSRADTHRLQLTPRDGAR